jgi:hypothetical protein
LNAILSFPCVPHASFISILLIWSAIQFWGRKTWRFNFAYQILSSYTTLSQCNSIITFSLLRAHLNIRLSSDDERWTRVSPTLVYWIHKMTIYYTDDNARSNVTRVQRCVTPGTLSTRVNARLEIHKIGIKLFSWCGASLRSIVQVLSLSVVLYKFQNGQRRIWHGSVYWRDWKETRYLGHGFQWLLRQT